MMDPDVYWPNEVAEEFLQLLKIKLRKDYEPIKVYISTANPCNSFYAKFFDNTKLTEESE